MKMLFAKGLQTALLSLAALQSTAAMTIAGKPNMMIKRYEDKLLQDIVTWDEHSLFVRGERIMFFSGEIHPFRLPVPALWLDVFQKIKALGYNGVSFYVDWWLHEGTPGNFTADGIFDLVPFFEAAQTAGIYLIARPGPYVQAEASGGGFPGWLQRNPAALRASEPGFEHATDNYIKHIGAIVAKAQITNGGPVVLVQPENEFSHPDNPDPEYFGYVEQQYRDAGIIVPLISNDAAPSGNFATGPPRKKNAPSIYGYDGYPLGFDCANPTVWEPGALPTDYLQLHLNQSSSTPNSIIEFQGGSFDAWGGSTFENCNHLTNEEFERVFYKNNYATGLAIFSIYMTYGGTNWGNIGHPAGYTSYDYGAVITEDRQVSREKYSEMKLEANFLQCSPAYLTAIAQDNSNAKGAYTGNEAMFTTALLGKRTNFFVVRHTEYETYDNTDYTITLPTSMGNITIPQLGGELSLNGRDSKFHVTDYDVGGINLLYSTAEIFTWKKYGNHRVLVVYGGPNERHELAISNGGRARLVEGHGVKFAHRHGETIINFETSPHRRIVQLSCELSVYILDRNSAYDYWVIDLPNDATTKNYTNYKTFNWAPIVKGGYLMRTVEVSHNEINLTGDLNSTAHLEIIGGPRWTRCVNFNGESIPFRQNRWTGVVTATAEYKKPDYSLPDLSTISWKAIDSLPEIKSGYDDSAWTKADLTYSNNTARNLTTPTSLYSSDYGYHAGSLLFRGHFTAAQKNSTLEIDCEGGGAFAHTVWLNGTYIGSWDGYPDYDTYRAYYPMPDVEPGKNYVLTVLIDHMGLNINAASGSNYMKYPRGILEYAIDGVGPKDVHWKLTGNLGGEDYIDHTRGPLNEGALFAERQGYHLPSAPTSTWRSSEGPTESLDKAGVKFYSTTFDLDMPAGYDIPLAIEFEEAHYQAKPSYRSQIWVNGYQFGKYVHNLGPQSVFPVPEGIWNYHGPNYVAVSVWAVNGEGAKPGAIKLRAGPEIQSGYGEVELSPMPGWSERAGAY